VWRLTKTTKHKTHPPKKKHQKTTPTPNPPMAFPKLNRAPPHPNGSLALTTSPLAPSESRNTLLSVHMEPSNSLSPFACASVFLLCIPPVLSAPSWSSSRSGHKLRLREHHQLNRSPHWSRQFWDHAQGSCVGRASTPFPALLSLRAPLPNPILASACRGRSETVLNNLSL